MSIFEELRALDDCAEPRSLRFSSTNLPMWPFIRWAAVSAAQEQVLRLEVPFAEHHRTPRQTAELLVRSMVRSPFAVRRPFDIVIVGSSAGIVIQRDGRWFDRINDYFAVELPERTLVLDTATLTGYKTPRFPPHVRCFDTFDIAAGIAARLRRPSDADLASIDRLVAFVRDRFPVAMPAAALERVRAHLVHYALRLPVLHRLYRRFFDRVKPRLIIMEDGSYGAFAHVCTWARQAGIATAEFQHGIVSLANLAYNFGDESRADPVFAATVPEHLLVYGEFWRTEARTPSQVTVTGCPHFVEMVNTAPRRPDGTIVTISQGIRSDLMVQLTVAAARQYPDRRFVFRMHPGEVPFRERFAALDELPNIEISDKGDIYELLRRATAVIGHSSTAIIEAAGMGAPTLIFDDETSRAMLPSQAGTWFRSAGELLPLLASPPRSAIDPEQFFASDWRERYRTFVSRVTLSP